MITVEKDSEFTLTIVDVIKKLDKMEQYVVRIWTQNSELSFNYDESWNLHFISESICASRDKKSVYIAMDSIVSIVIIEDGKLEDLI